MQGRSIRSFALDYYRKQGAEIRPLEEGGEAYEIVSTDGAALKVTFSGETDEIPLTATSPQWRAILEDITSELAVSYRYLVTGPIGNPAKVLTALMLRGWEVKAAKFVKAEVKQALGVTHRVTFDSPALTVRQEMIHHHVWDLAREERLAALEPMLYTAPCLLIRPEIDPEERQVERLVASSVDLVDHAIDREGVEIERELAELLTEAEKRTNQYFEQQMNNVLQREIMLTEKLDSVIRKLSEAKSPEQVARYRADGQSLEEQLAQLRARREHDLQAVESACQAKLVEEREKHELTATTDLVALCHASYDVLTYDAVVVDPAGDEARMTVRYWPVMRKLELPACPYCHQAMQDPVVLGGGDIACASCVATCEGCGTRHPHRDYVAHRCGTCRTAVCGSCETRCIHCETTSCTDHELGCGTCEAPVCHGCAKTCAVCETQLCQHHAHRDAVDAKFYCADHRQMTPVEEVASAELEAAAVAPVAVGETALEAPAEEAPAEAPAAIDVEDALAVLYAHKQERVVSKLSGREVHRAKAETCYACEGDYEVQEMVDCPTCGVPSCQPCTEGVAGPCPACEGMERVQPDDARLRHVFAQFPALAKGRRKWSVSVQGPYTVAMWSRMGWWGMVVYHTGGPEPVTLSDFACGPLETARNSMAAWLGGRK